MQHKPHEMPVAIPLKLGHLQSISCLQQANTRPAGDRQKLPNPKRTKGGHLARPSLVPKHPAAYPINPFSVADGRIAAAAFSSDWW